MLNVSKISAKLCIIKWKQYAIKELRCQEPIDRVIVLLKKCKIVNARTRVGIRKKLFIKLLCNSLEKCST